MARIPVALQEELEVQELWVDVLMELKVWKRVVRMARTVTAKKPESERAWIAWAYALRELQQIEEAQEVLLRAEKLHGRKSGVLHYNLACYACLLGDQDEAERRLNEAIEKYVNEPDRWPALLAQRIDPNSIPDRALAARLVVGCAQFGTNLQRMVSVVRQRST